MSSPPPRPPRAALALLRLLVPKEWADAAEGDLRERYARRRAERGRWSADAWAWKQVLGSRPLESRRAMRTTEGGGGMMGGWDVDLRGAVHGARHRPAVSAAVAATVAVAVGVTTAVFSVVNGVLLRPLDFPDSDRLVRAWQTNPEWEGHSSLLLRQFARRLPLSVPTFHDWASATTGFETLGIETSDGRVWQGPERAENVSTVILTHGIFAALDVQPLLGRTLDPEDDLPGAPAVAVLSHGFWRDRLGGDPDALGTTLVLDRVAHTVVGVMPPGFAIPGREGALMWTSLPEERKVDERSNQSFTVLGRLRPGATVASLQADLSALQERLAESYEDDNDRDRGANVQGLLESEVGEVGTTLWFLLGAVGIVLAIACLNIANMLSVTGLTRRSELAVRAALGAGRGRLVRALLFESGALAVLGGLVGVAVAWLALPALVAVLPPGLPRTQSVSMDGTVFLFGMAVTTLTALAVGSLPAFRAGSVDPGRAMAEGSRSVAGGVGDRVRAALVVTEVALAFALLVGAGLLARSYLNLWTEDRGFPTEGLAVMTVVPDAEAYPEPADRARFVTDLRDRLRGLGGIQVTATNQVPLSGSTSSTSYDIERADGTVAEDANVLIAVTDPAFLDVMGIPLLEGRYLTERDGPDDVKIVVVNQALADAYWPGVSPIGRRIGDVARDEWRTVTGVVGNVRHQSLEEAPEPKIYLAAAQSDRDVDQWVLRSPDPRSALSQARAVVAELAPTTPVGRAMVLDERIAQSVALPRFRTLFVVSLAGLATLLALLGVYGVVAFAVSQRTREVALRMALGARPGEVVGATLSSGLKLCAGGLALGLAVALAGARILDTFLYDLPTTDPLAYAAGALVVGAVGLAAGYVPARRAAAVDPMSVLKSE